VGAHQDADMSILKGLITLFGSVIFTLFFNFIIGAMRARDNSGGSLFLSPLVRVVARSSTHTMIFAAALMFSRRALMSNEHINNCKKSLDPTA
jgi:hypothetical protein